MTDPVVDPAYCSAMDFLYGRLNYERLSSVTAKYPFRLKRTDQLLSAIGLDKYRFSQNARPAVPIVHVAGTKGKGSTCRMVAAALTASGLRTGTYTSPHIHQLEERFVVDGEMCPPDRFVQLVNQLQPIVQRVTDQSGVPPSFFELTTCLALMHFERSECDVVVLEVGLGGRLDSTNVCAATVAAITSIGLDHQHVLGDTLAEIAAEKAGIVKSSAPVVCGVTDEQPLKVIQDVALQNSASLFAMGDQFSFRYQPADDWGGRMIWQGQNQPLREHRELNLALEGEHQAHNAAIAFSILDLLKSNGVAVDEDNAIAAISELTFPARIERFDLPHGDRVIVDAAHNGDSVDALCDCVGQRSSGRNVKFVFGTSRDKDAIEMLEQISKTTDAIILTRYHLNPRFRCPQELLGQLPPRIASKCVVEENPIAACQRALERDDEASNLVVVCGSFFLAAETRQWVSEQCS